MKKALISPLEVRYDGSGREGMRVAFVAVAGEEFPVAEPLHWVKCPDACVQDKWVYVDGKFIEIVEPEPEVPESETPIDKIITI